MYKAFTKKHSKQPLVKLCSQWQWWPTSTQCIKASRGRPSARATTLGRFWVFSVTVYSTPLSGKQMNASVSPSIHSAAPRGLLSSIPTSQWFYLPPSFVPGFSQRWPMLIIKKTRAIPFFPELLMLLFEGSINLTNRPETLQWAFSLSPHACLQ